MRDLPAGWATDLAILELSGSSIEHYDDHLALRSPENPEYHWGNCILITDPHVVDDAARFAARFAELFPSADWVAIGLPTVPTETTSWTDLNIELESVDVLTTVNMPKQRPLPEGYSVRPLTLDDWAAFALKDIAENAESGRYDHDIHERFIYERNAIRQGLCSRGHAVWVGAFDESGDLAASLGIVRCGASARYQDVITQPTHRRKGLAAHLLGVAAAWSVEQGCERWVIVTESTNDAGRVYRRAGFELDTAIVNAYRVPPIAGT